MPVNKRGGDDDIEPFLDHFAIDAGDFEHQEGQHGGHHQLPHRLHPEMDDIPPEHLVFRQIARVVEREQEEDGDAPQAEQQHIGDRRLAPLQHGHADVEQEDQRGDDDAELHPQRLLQIGARVRRDDGGRDSPPPPPARRGRRWRTGHRRGSANRFRAPPPRESGNRRSRKSRAAARRSAHWCGSCE